MTSPREILSVSALWHVRYWFYNEELSCLTVMLVVNISSRYPGTTRGSLDSRRFCTVSYVLFCNRLGASTSPAYLSSTMRGMSMYTAETSLCPVCPLEPRLAARKVGFVVRVPTISDSLIPYTWQGIVSSPRITYTLAEG